jgi:predicted GNAT superfamily acetyltransferase
MAHDRGVRPATARDEQAILVLNAESEWAMSPLDEAGLRHLLAMDGLALVAEPAGQVLGFALALTPDQPYDSANYRWFGERFSKFLYLDRVAVRAQMRRQGIASALYDVLEEAARPWGRILCEVNIEPINPVSLAFHASRDYERVGVLAHGEAKAVAMLEKRFDEVPPDR